MVSVFVTGSTGFIGTAVTKVLVARGYTVNGLCRSESSAAKLRALGGNPVIGNLTDLDLLNAQAKASDGVIHLAFGHDGDFAKAALVDRAAINAMLDGLDGSGKPFLGTNGLGVCAVPVGAELQDETCIDQQLPPPVSTRHENERIVCNAKSRNIRSQVLRLSPTVHGEGDHGFVHIWKVVGQQLGSIPYPTDGLNEWSAVNVSDAAEAYALAFESGPAGSVWHIAAESVRTVDIATALGEKAGLPAKSVPAGEDIDALGFIWMIMKTHNAAKTQITRSALKWEPKGDTLLNDIINFY